MSNACLFSGGKDSTLALHKAIAQGIDVDLLITFVSENEYSYMFHYPNIESTKLQAEALGIRQVFVGSAGVKEEELKDIENALTDNDVKVLITGAVASTYQKDRIEAICKRHKIECISPLWQIDPIIELNELARDYNVIIIQVTSEGFDESFLGARIDGAMIERLQKLYEKYRINRLFEGGEAESFVLDAPLFKKRIEIKQAEKVWSKGTGRLVIKRAELVDKDKKFK